jgi:hypothetical protein
MSVPLVKAPDGSLRFKRSSLTPSLRRYAEQKRLAGERLNAEHEERLFAENMALLGEPTMVRDVRHLMRTNGAQASVPE